MATLQQRIQERYPSLSFLMANAEMRSLLTRAVNESWSPGQFQSKFIASKWFRSQSETQRRWAVMLATDPSEARRQTTTWRTGLQQTAARLGAVLTAAELKYITNLGLQRGGEPDDQETINGLLALMGRKGHTKGTQPGLYQTTGREVTNLVNSQWMRGIDAKYVTKWALDITAGRKTMEDLQAVLAGQAMKRFPHMVEGLKSGMTVQEIVQPYIDLVAEELEIHPSQVQAKIKANDPAFRQILGVLDPKTNQMRLPTENEMIRLARERSTWTATTKGRQMTAGMTTALLRAFGARA